MVFKIALYLVLEKKMYFYFSRKYFEAVGSYENDFQEMSMFNELG